MAYTGIWQDNLPWSDNENDRKLVGYVFVSLIVSTILFTIVQFLPLQEVKQKKLEEVAPRLAKRIIENYHKGKIYVKHSKIGEGTTFAIHLPKKSNK